MSQTVTYPGEKRPLNKQQNSRAKDNPFARLLLAKTTYVVTLADLQIDPLLC
ncbi:hypothetical protein [Paenibacillus xerothermodurans]|uniref:hypothetical protein n=1 Tax=Paenibacillus xerothermodurans TaxID=1977292 RepID=UPI001402871F|nr:hypothetical protein [Paenibacillus xerothermodurans]